MVGCISRKMGLIIGYTLIVLIFELPLPEGESQLPYGSTMYSFGQMIYFESDGTTWAFDTGSLEISGSWPYVSGSFSSNPWSTVGSIPTEAVDYSRYTTIYGDYEYDVYNGTKTNIYTSASEAWSIPAGIQAGYAVVGSYTGFLYLTNVEEYEVGEETLERLVVWVYDISGETWTKLTYDEAPWNDIDVYDNGGSDNPYFDGLATDEEILLLTNMYGEYGYAGTLVRIPMLEFEAAVSYIVSNGTNIIRVNPGTNQIEIYDPDTNTWSTPVSLSGSIPNGGVVYNPAGVNEILVMGGTIAGANNTDVYRLNPVTGVVENIGGDITHPHVSPNASGMITGPSGFATGPSGFGLPVWGGTGSGYQAYLEIYNYSTGQTETIGLEYFIIANLSGKTWLSVIRIMRDFLLNGWLAELQFLKVSLLWICILWIGKMITTIIPSMRLK
jgi:hypothetical protein